MTQKFGVALIGTMTALVAGCSGSGSGGPACTTEPQSAWMSESAMKERITALGYKVKEFKISGQCYEIYGWNQQGQKVEVYFDPVDGKVFKSEIE